MVIGLQEVEIRFVLVGGLAATAHGASRVTDDLDICYDRERDNLDRLSALLASWDAYPRDMEPGAALLHGCQDAEERVDPYVAHAARLYRPAGPC